MGRLAAFPDTGRVQFRGGKMDYLAFGPYFLALVAYAASPGPLMAVLVARSLGHDWKGATAFAAGLCLGEVIAVIGVVLGIGIWAQTQPELLALAKYLGVAYLLWLALKMWRSSAEGRAPKVQMTGWAAAVGAGVDAAVILDGRIPHGLLLEIFTRQGAGTLVRA